MKIKEKSIVTCCILSLILSFGLCFSSFNFHKNSIDIFIGGGVNLELDSVWTREFTPREIGTIFQNDTAVQVGQSNFFTLNGRQGSSTPMEITNHSRLVDGDLVTGALTTQGAGNQSQGNVSFDVPINNMASLTVWALHTTSQGEGDLSDRGIVFSDDKENVEFVGWAGSSNNTETTKVSMDNLNPGSHSFWWNGSIRIFLVKVTLVGDSPDIVEPPPPSGPKWQFNFNADDLQLGDISRGDTQIGTNQFMSVRNHSSGGSVRVQNYSGQAFGQSFSKILDLRGSAASQNGTASDRQRSVWFEVPQYSKSGAKLVDINIDIAAALSAEQSSKTMMVHASANGVEQANGDAFTIDTTTLNEVTTQFSADDLYKDNGLFDGVFLIYQAGSNFGGTGSGNLGISFVSVTLTFDGDAGPLPPPPQIPDYAFIQNPPQSQTVLQGGVAHLTVSAFLPPSGGFLSYMWFVTNVSGDDKIDNGLLIEGVDSAEFYPPTSEVGSNWYFVIVLNNSQTGHQAKTISHEIEVKVLPSDTKVDAKVDGKKSIFVGESTLLTAMLSPITFEALVWSTSDAQVVDVSQNGLVTGVSQGKATITAQFSVGEVTYQTKFEVVIKDPLNSNPSIVPTIIFFGIIILIGALIGASITVLVKKRASSK
ncbi:MAG: Ig-like domain-containing protein [Clostridiales bacterium]|nr:Ig-like domain-containing protein [Clostridiales bacterium]